MLGESSRSTYHIPKASTWLGSGFRAIAQSDMQVNVAVGSNVSGIEGTLWRARVVGGGPFFGGIVGGPFFGGIGGIPPPGLSEGLRHATTLRVKMC